ncbi:MarR family transcripitonal regulator [Sulfolobus acidocaldarius SUSAZ]|nr:MarR family transcripitonal regulator [Sulfolobus acidocaldarius SUSAZ]
MSDSKNKIINILKNYGELSQSDLVKLSQMSKSRVSEILSELEKDGIIERRRLIGKNLAIRLSSSKFLSIGIIKAAEYPFVVPFVRSLRDKGFIVDVKIYNNGLDLTRDLATGKIDMGFSPLVTQLIFQKIFNDFKIIAGGARGGGAIVGNSLDSYIGSTALSSMELWTMLFDPHLDIVEYESPEHLIMSLNTKRTNAISIWEPYPTILTRNGYKILHRFDEHNCCTLAVNTKLDSEFLLKIYYDSFEKFLSQKDRWIQDYSNLVGIEYNILKEATNNYIFDPIIDLEYIKKNLRRNNVLV